MSVTTTVLPDTEAAPKPKKSRKKLLIVVVAVLLLLGGGGFVGKGMLAGSSTTAPDPKVLPGDVVTLAPITMNLADGHYLKLTLALQLSEAASPVAGSTDAAAGAVPALDGAKALDSAIAILGEHTYAQLLAPAGRTSAQKVLSARVKKRYGGDVLGVYFTEFLMQ